VFRGLVVFGGEIPGLGNVVVLDHGGDYHTVYARLAAPAVSSGDILDVGASIGRGGSLAASGRVEFYFEVRDRGVPVNPEEWLH
jgi:septal ring factor EnvC (AmiA/AmiB activator)